MDDWTSIIIAIVLLLIVVALATAFLRQKSRIKIISGRGAGPRAKKQVQKTNLFLMTVFISLQ